MMSVNSGWVWRHHPAWNAAENWEFYWCFNGSWVLPENYGRNTIYYSKVGCMMGEYSVPQNWCPV